MDLSSHLITSTLNKSINRSTVNPWGVEPQSKEPESFILSIELRVQILHFGEMRGKVTTSRVQNKENRFFFCRDQVTSPIYRQHNGIFCNFAKTFQQKQL